MRKKKQALVRALLAISFLSIACLARAEEIVYVVNSYVHDPTDPHTQVLAVRGKSMAILDHLELWGYSGHTAAVAPDGEDLWVTCPPSNVIFRIDTATLTVADDYFLGDVILHDPMGIDFTPDGTRAWITFAQTGKILVLNGETMAYVDEFTIGGLPNFVVFTPDGTKAYVVDYQNATVRAIRTSDHAILATLNFTGHALQDAVVTPDGTRVYVSNMESNQIEVIRTSDDAVLAPIVTSMINPRGIGVSPDGNYLFVGHYLGVDSKVVMMRRSDATVLSTVDIPSNPRRIAVRENGRRIYVTEHNEDALYAYNVDGESLTLFQFADCNLTPGELASPVGVALGAVDHPRPDVKLDGSDLPIHRTRAESVQLCLNMDARGRTDSCDWWLVEDGPRGLLFWSPATGWTATRVTAYQGPLRDFSNFCSPPTPLAGYPPGKYDFYFGVDVQMDGITQKALMYWNKGVLYVDP